MRFETGTFFKGQIFFPGWVEGLVLRSIFESSGPYERNNSQNLSLEFCLQIIECKESYTISYHSTLMVWLRSIFWVHEDRHTIPLRSHCLSIKPSPTLQTVHNTVNTTVIATKFYWYSSYREEPIMIPCWICFFLSFFFNLCFPLLFFFH